MKMFGISFVFTVASVLCACVTDQGSNTDSTNDSDTADQTSRAIDNTGDDLYLSSDEASFDPDATCTNGATRWVSTGNCGCGRPPLGGTIYREQKCESKAWHNLSATRCETGCE